MGKWVQEWVTLRDNFGEITPVKILSGYTCSICGRTEKEKEPYCHCGAKMDL